jgi:chaperonin GroES
LKRVRSASISHSAEHGTAGASREAPARAPTRGRIPFGYLSIAQEMEMQIRPLYDRVIVKRIEQQRTTASGIVIPDSAAEKPEQGEVIAVGSGRLLQDGTQRALQLKVGDQVIFGKYSGQTVKVDGEELLVMREEDVMGVLEAGQDVARQAA